MKLTILGNCGSGKTMLANKISTKLGVPHLQLDRLFFELGGYGWRKKSEEYKDNLRNSMKERVEQFIKQDSWISDGWYQRIQPIISDKADKVIFLDIPLRKRLMNHVKRMFFTKRHGELTKWDDFKFIFEIIERTFTHDPQMRAFVEQYRSKSIILKSYTEAGNYLESLVK